MAEMFKGENFDEFDKSKLHLQNFPFQYFAVELNNLNPSILVIFMAHARVHTDHE